MTNNTELTMTEDQPEENGQDQARPVKRGGGLAWFSLLLALASLVASGWLWWQGAGVKQGAAEQFAADLTRQEQLLAKADARSAAVESQLSDFLATDPERRLRALEQALDSLQQSNGSSQTFEDDTAARIGLIQAGLKNAQARLAAAETRLSVMSARTVNSSAELDLAEVDYLLRLAQERLALFADAQTADRALEIAGRHIAAFDNPMYIGIEQEIAAARQQLSLLRPLDYQMLDQKLDLLQGSLENLAFKGEGKVPEQQQKDAAPGMWARIRKAFSGLVTVRRMTTDQEQIPVLADQELIRRQAWLQLEVARWAAARRDQVAFSQALNRFSATLERWFDPPAGVTDNLRELQQQHVNPPVPDISAPWTSLRALQGISVSRPSQTESAPQAEGASEVPAEAEIEEQQQDQDPAPNPDPDPDPDPNPDPNPNPNPDTDTNRDTNTNTGDASQ